MRLEPIERIIWATTAGWPLELAPGMTSTYLTNWITCNLFCGLVRIGRDFEIEPDLAERFSVSDDGRAYRFTLRPDARWSDGEPVTAEDFAFTFAQMIEDEVESAAWLDGVCARSVDERVLEIRLDEPRNHFLYQLGLRGSSRGQATFTSVEGETATRTFRPSATARSFSRAALPARMRGRRTG
jgi:ABC-type transport system substrate-binding protein